MSNIKRFSSRKEVTEFLKEKGIDTSNWSEEKWLQLNKGQAEIHIMDLAEKIYDAVNESIPKQLKAGEWHIPFEKNISSNVLKWSNDISVQAKLLGQDLSLHKVKVSTAMAARTSYTVVGDEKEIDYSKMIELHDRLIAQDPPHSSPLEHCARTMSDSEYESFYKGQIGLGGESGWCGPYKGFISYRHFIDNNLEIW